MKRIIGRALASVAICMVTNALIIGIFSDITKTDDNDSIFYATYIALLFILLFGYFLLYLPGILLFDWVVAGTPYRSYLFFGAVGALVGAFMSLPNLLLSYGELTTQVLLAMPWGRQAITIPTMAIVGAVYGLAYRLFWLSRGTDEEKPADS